MKSLLKYHFRAYVIPFCNINNKNQSDSNFCANRSLKANFQKKNKQNKNLTERLKLLIRGFMKIGHGLVD